MKATDFIESLKQNNVNIEEIIQSYISLPYNERISFIENREFTDLFVKLCGIVKQYNNYDIIRFIFRDLRESISQISEDTDTIDRHKTICQYMFLILFHYKKELDVNHIREIIEEDNFEIVWHMTCWIPFIEALFQNLSYLGISVFSIPNNLLECIIY